MEQSRILIVDDNEGNRYPLSRRLKKAGYEVLEVGTGRECLERVAHARIDLILLDINLPDFSGIEVCMRLKKNPRTERIPVIQISALLIGVQNRVEGLESGADAYLAAPFDERELLAHVKHLLRVQVAEERLYQSVALNPQMPWTAATDGKLENVGEQWCALTGLSQEELAGGGWQGTQHPEDLPAFVESWSRSIYSGEPFDFQHRIRRADGVYRWARSRAYPQRDGDGNIVRWFGFTEDIHERMSAQAALRDSQELLASIYSGVEAAITVSDVLADGTFRFVTANRACVEWTGIPLERWIGSRPQDILPAHEAETVCTHYRQAVQAGKSISYEEKISFPANCISAVTTVAPIRDAAGHIRRIVATSTDISEQKRVEEALEAAARLPAENPDGVMRLRKDHLMEYANGPGKALMALINGGREDVPPQFIEAAEAALRDKKRLEFEIIAGDKAYLVNVSPVPGPGYVNFYTRDITAVKSAQDALRESELFHRQALESIPGMVFTTRPDGYCDFQSQQWTDYTGIPFEQQLGNGWNNLLHPDDRSRAMECWKAAVEGRAPYELEYRVRRHDGQYEWFRVIGRPIRNERGEIVRWFGVAANVNDLKRTEDALRASEARFRAVFESSSDCILVWDRDYNYLYANQAAIDHVGATRDKVIGKSIRDGLGHVPHFMQLWMARVDQAFATGKSFRVEDTVTVGDRVIHSESQLSPIRDASGQIFAVGVVYRDVTERREAAEALRQSEEKLRQAADLVGLCPYTWKPQTGELEWDPRIRPMWGLPPDAPIDYAIWRSGIAPEDLAYVEDRVARSLDPANDGLYEAEYRVNGADGVQRWISTRGRTVFADGKPIFHTGVAVEITARKHAEEALRKAKDELARANTNLEHLVAERTASLKELVGELEHFSYTITHDMRAPLRAMQGFTEIAQEALDSGDPGEAGEFLRRIKMSAGRMDGLITDALHYSRVVRNQLPLGPVDPGHLLRGMLDTYPDFQAANAKIIIEPGIPLVMGNDAGLTQCFSNLLGNAVKFAAPGRKAEVRVRAEAKDGWVRLWVEDNGIGISENLLPRVFDMFARGSNPAAGTGIGLALVRKVVDRMGGKVGVESRQGSGSRFWIELRSGDVKSSPAAPISG